MQPLLAGQGGRSSPSCPVVAFGLTLGAHPPALDALETDPHLFPAIGGGIREVHDIGMQRFGLGVLGMVGREFLVRDPLVPRARSFGLAAGVGLAIALTAAGLMPPRPAGGLGFLVPAMRGAGLWRAGRATSGDGGVRHPGQR